MEVVKSERPGERDWRSQEAMREENVRQWLSWYIAYGPYVHSVSERLSLMREGDLVGSRLRSGAFH